MNTIRCWLIRLLGGEVRNCKHKWTVLIENYPTYTQDYWQCKRCKFTKAFQNSEPPEPIRTAFCSMAHSHIVNGRNIPREATLEFILEQNRIKASTGANDHAASER